MYAGFGSHKRVHHLEIVNVIHKTETCHMSVYGNEWDADAKALLLVFARQGHLMHS